MNSPKTWKTLSILALLPLTASAEAWKSDSDPMNLISPTAPGAQPYNYNFDSLPPAAELAESNRPWSGPYWSVSHGVIGYRWQTNEKGGKYKVHTADEVRAMSRADIELLSPAEKFDILRGDYSYRTLNATLEFADNANSESSFITKLLNWKGICNDYSQAAAQIIEPVSTTLKSQQTKDAPFVVDVPFNSGDLKALASYYYEDPNGGYDLHNQHTRRLGTKCQSGKIIGAPYECRRDVNAGAFHVAITNQIAVLGESIFADISKGRQVWQHPIYGYSFEKTGERAPSPGAAPTTKREVHVKMELYLADYANASTEPNPMHTKTRKVRYWVELDPDGNIVGGKYVDIGARPVDYLWVSDQVPLTNGYELLSPALKPRTAAAPLFRKPVRPDHPVAAGASADSQN